MRNKLEARTPVDVRQWHVLYTRHQHEKPVARILSSKGHEVFLPLYAAAHRWKDRTKHLCLPLFPSYVFIRGGMDSQLQVLSTLEYLRSWDGRATPRQFPRDTSKEYAKWSKAHFVSSLIPI